MNELQRALVFFTVFAVGTGIVSAPFHGESFTTGVVAGIAVLCTIATLALCVVWVITGREGVSIMVEKVLE